MQRIDTHVHFWRLDRGDYAWISPRRPAIHRDFLPSDFQGSPCIAVQAAPTRGDTEFLLDLAEANPEILGVVGWCDLTSPDIAAQVGRMAQHPKLVGIRPIEGAARGREWLDTPEFEAGFAALSRADLVVEALALPHHLHAIERIARRHPALRIVINHAAKPTAANFGNWSRNLAGFARLNNVFCKLSGLTQQSRSRYHHARVFDTLLRCFGPKRLVWGSDFPVLLETSTPTQWDLRSKQLMAHLSPSEQACIRMRTARRLYALKQGNTK